MSNSTSSETISNSNINDQEIVISLIKLNEYYSRDNIRIGDKHIELLINELLIKLEFNISIDLLKIYLSEKRQNRNLLFKKLMELKKKEELKFILKTADLSDEKYLEKITDNIDPLILNLYIKHYCKCLTNKPERLIISLYAIQTKKVSEPFLNNIKYKNMSYTFFYTLYADYLRYSDNLDKSTSDILNKYFKDGILHFEKNLSEEKPNEEKPNEERLNEERSNEETKDEKVKRLLQELGKTIETLKFESLKFESEDSNSNSNSNSIAEKKDKTEIYFTATKNRNEYVWSNNEEYPYGLSVSVLFSNGHRSVYNNILTIYSNYPKSISLNKLYTYSNEDCHLKLSNRRNTIHNIKYIKELIITKPNIY